jgi:hypothetical protein
MQSARQSPQILRATLGVALVGGALLVALVAFAVASLYVGGSSSTNDSGAVQGFLLIAGALLVCIVYALVVLPAVAYYLASRGTYSERAFVNVQRLVILLLASLAGIAAGGGLIGFAVASASFLVVALLVCVPLTRFWLWLAK